MRLPVGNFNFKYNIIINKGFEVLKYEFWQRKNKNSNQSYKRCMPALRQQSHQRMPGKYGKAGFEIRGVSQMSEKTQNFSLVFLRAALVWSFRPWLPEASRLVRRIWFWCNSPVFPANGHTACSWRAGDPGWVLRRLMVLLGFFTRIGAAGIAVTMAVALFTVHLPQGFS